MPLKIPTEEAGSTHRRIYYANSRLAEIRMKKKIIIQSRKRSADASFFLKKMLFGHLNFRKHRGSGQSSRIFSVKNKQASERIAKKKQ